MDIGPAERSGREVVTERRAGQRRRWVRRVALMVVAVVVLGLGLRWLHWQFTHVVLDDARVGSDMTVLSSRAPGWVREIAVSPGDRVPRGALLARMDARDAALAVEQYEARLAGMAARRAELEARLALVDQTSRSQHEAARARLDAARAALPSAEAERVFAEAELDRAERLSATGAATRQRLEQLRLGAESARQRVLSAGADIRNAEAMMAVALAAREEMGVITAQIEALGPQARELEVQRDRAALEVEDRTLRMPFDGVVNRVFLEPGEHVQAGQRMILIHNPANVWVDANVKETEVRHFRLGTRVTVTVDAWPGERFEGEVERLIEAATSQFALLPSANPSGNFTRITQRLPLRVRLDPPPPPGMLRPGMLARVTARADGEGIPARP